MLSDLSQETYKVSQELLSFLAFWYGSHVQNTSEANLNNTFSHWPKMVMKMSTNEDNDAGDWT